MKNTCASNQPCWTDERGGGRDEDDDDDWIDPDDLIIEEMLRLGYEQQRADRSTTRDRVYAAVYHLVVNLNSIYYAYQIMKLLLTL